MREIQHHQKIHQHRARLCLVPAHVQLEAAGPISAGRHWESRRMFVAALWADGLALCTGSECQPCAGFPTGFSVVCLSLGCGFLGRLRGC